MESVEGDKRTNAEKLEAEAANPENMYISPEEEALSNEEIYARNDDYVSNGFAINIHTSPAEAGSSIGCQNVPVDTYVDFMREVNGSSNKGNILYTLIDASKVELDLVSQQNMSNP